MLRGAAPALLGALGLAALATLFDFVWARYIPAHRAVFGLLHGALLCLGIGGWLGALRGRVVRGVLGGTGVGLAAAAGFYALAPALGIGAMFACWVALWLGFAVLDGSGLGAATRLGPQLARGALAAAGSGLAFYAISGIWTRPDPGRPDYPLHFLSWTLAFLPGFAALLLFPRKAGATAESAGGGRTPRPASAR